MPGPGELLEQQPAPIIGREAGLAWLRGLVEPVPRAGRVLLVTGDAGMGKTVLLADTAGRARSAGMRVLWVTGRESESKLVYAGLHQLLRPVLSGAAGLSWPAGTGSAERSRPCRGPRYSRPAAHRGGCPDPAVGSF